MPEVPVVSPISGHVFEKRIIEKYIAENGVDPFTNKELKVEDLIEIKSKYARKVLKITLFLVKMHLT